MTQSLIQLLPELWVAQSRIYATNSGIALSNGRACLIDPAVFPDEIDGIARFVTGQGAVLEYLVITHSHWDHILGPERFAGVPVLAHDAYRVEVQGEGGDRLQRQIAAWEEEYAVVRQAPFVLPLPDETFVQQCTLILGDLELYLVHAPGHAADQLVVYFPQRATLWAADMLSDAEIPFVSHDLSAYERTLAFLSTLDIRILIPGHGHPTADAGEIQGRIQEDLAYLSVLRDLVESAVRERRTLDQALDLCASMRYRHPEENRIPHRLNVETAYVQMGGVADPARVGWSNQA